jgi:hypothetical protein
MARNAPGMHVGQKNSRATAFLFSNKMLSDFCTTLLSLGSLCSAHVRTVRIRQYCSTTTFPRILYHV